MDPSPIHPPSKKSTNVRSRDRSRRVSGTTNVVRALVRASGVLAPRLTARMLQERFFTPPRWPTSDRTREALARAESFWVQWDGGRVRCWAWGTGPVVYLVHGWGGIGGQLASFVGPLVAAGFRVVTFDGPAHGLSEGRTSNVLQFRDALRAVVAEEGRGAGVLGHSLGGAACAYAVRDGLDVDRIVLVGTPADLTLYVRGFLSRLGVSRGVEGFIVDDFERRYSFSWDDLQILGFAPRMTTPLLLLHDREDAEVPWADAASIAVTWPGARVVTTSGLGHYRILHDEGAIQSVVDFLREKRHAADAATPSAQTQANASPVRA